MLDLIEKVEYPLDANNRDLISTLFSLVEGSIFKDISDELKGNPHFILDMVSLKGIDVLNFITDDLKQNAEFFIRLLAQTKDPSLFRWAAGELKSQPNFILGCLCQFGFGRKGGVKKNIILHQAGNNLKRDAHFIVEAYKLSTFEGVFNWMDDELKNDKQFQLDNVSETGRRMLKHITDEQLLEDEDFLIKILEMGHPYIASPKRWRDNRLPACFQEENFLLDAALACPEMLKYLNSDILNLQLILKMIEKNPAVFDIPLKQFSEEDRLKMQLHMLQFYPEKIGTLSINTNTWQNAQWLNEIVRMQPKSFDYISTESAKKLLDKEVLQKILDQNFNFYQQLAEMGNTAFTKLVNLNLDSEEDRNSLIHILHDGARLMMAPISWPNQILPQNVYEEEFLLTAISIWPEIIDRLDPNILNLELIFKIIERNYDVYHRLTLENCTLEELLKIHLHILIHYPRQFLYDYTNMAWKPEHLNQALRINFEVYNYLSFHQKKLIDIEVLRELVDQNNEFYHRLNNFHKIALGMTPASVGKLKKAL